jgi:pyruvate-formate lyase
MKNRKKYVLPTHHKMTGRQCVTIVTVMRATCKTLKLLLLLNTAKFNIWHLKNDKNKYKIWLSALIEGLPFKISYSA